MRLSTTFPQFRSLFAVPFLAAMLVLTASAETTPNAPPAASQSSSGPSATNPDAAPAASQPTAETPATSPDAAPAASQPAAPEASPPDPATAETTPDAASTVPAGETDGVPSDPNTAETDPITEPEKPKSTVVVNIDKSSQEMTIFVDGVELYSWPVSTGLGRGYSTPSGSYTASSMNKIWYSKQWDNAPMPHSIFFTKKGHAIHGTKEVKRLGKPASHGCVRLSPANAATLYALVEANGLEQTQVVLTGTTPGGEGPPVVASPGRWPDERYAAPPWFGPGDGYREKPRKRRGLFGRRWFDGPQGYYAPRNRDYYPPYPPRRGY